MVKNLDISLQTFYESYSQEFKAMAARFGKSGLSGPVLMAPEETAYPFQFTRLLIVNTEIRGWKCCGGEVAGNMENYASLGTNNNRRDFTFWETRATLERILENDPGSSAWTSLSKFSFEMSAYDAIYRKEIERFDELLMGELVRVKPDVVVFMTGSENDKRISRMLEGMKIKKADGFDFDELATMHHVFLPKRAYRIKHPSDFGERGIDTGILKFIAQW